MKPVAVLLLGLTLLINGPAQAQSAPNDCSISSHNFRYCVEPSQRGLAESLSKVAETYRRKVQADLGRTLAGNTRVVVARGLAKMRAAAPKGTRVPPWAAGMAFSRRNLILLRVENRRGAVNDITKVFVHELAHLALDQAVNFRRLPRWFHEGFAIHHSGEWSMGRTTALAHGVLSNRLFSLEALTESFPDKPPDVDLAYAQSIDFVAFLLHRFGRERFRKLIGLLGQDWPFLLGVEEAYDMGIFKLEQEWHGDLKMRFTWIPFLTGTATLWFLASLVFIAAYLRRRRTKRLGRALLDAQEDEDVPDPPLTPFSP
ncbi:MAG: hypothetical protein JRF33_05925 [Deltaproteobacteria bacterium]|nr:hypothetical protein [Deltaproteobacteria bacterium]